MKEPDDLVDIYLKPGEYFWGDRKTRIRTLLGSCVSFCFWHPRHFVGGMCHYMLPHRGMDVGRKRLDGRYADEAMELFLQNIGNNGTKIKEYQVKLFGGATLSLHLESNTSVSMRNIITAHEMAQKFRLNVVSENMGGTGYRKLQFDIWTGSVWLNRQKAAG